MEPMPRQRPIHLHREMSRHGTPTWYVRIGKGPRIRIRAEYGTDAFNEAYRRAIAGEPIAGPGTKFPTNTLGWLIARYRESTAWTELSLATRRQRENILRHILKSAGAEPLARVDHKVIVAGRDRRREHPNAARHFVQTMRGLFQWATEAEHVAEDPTRDVKTPRPETEGHLPWPQSWREAYEARWPLGTRQRLAYAVLAYTGLRRGDAVRLGRPHVKNGVATIRTEKTGEIVTVPVLAPLQAAIDAGPIGELTYIASEAGKPITKEGFGNLFRKWCRAADVPGSAHGLRKTLATIMAENGASVAQLEALFGWRGGGMASLYTDSANRAKLATGAADKMLSEQDANIYARTITPGAGKSGKSKTKSKR